VYKCPKCSSSNIEVLVQAWAMLRKDGDVEPVYAYEWQDDAPMQCMDCGQYGLASTFETEGE